MALVMVAVFAAFSVLFIIDGSDPQIINFCLIILNLWAAANWLDKRSNHNDR